MSDKILEILGNGNFVSGESMSRELGISRSAVWKRINVLREEGWQIASCGKKGYRLDVGDSLNPSFWEGTLTTKYIGKGEIQCLETVDSTNTQLKRMALAGAPSGSICVSEQQTAGKGRLGRQWESPAGAGLWLSVLLRPNMKPEDAPVITFAAAIAMADAIRDTAGIDARIKWPNDIVCEGRKICGILLEVACEVDMLEHVIIGTGVNFKSSAYSPSLREKAISLEEMTGGVIPLRRTLLSSYLVHLEGVMEKLESGGFAAISQEYRRQSVTLGNRVQVSGSENFVGIAEDMDSSGALLVRDDSLVLHRVLAGDVSVRGIMGYA